MIESLRRIIRVSGIFKEMGWSDKRVSHAMMYDLLQDLLNHYCRQISEKYDPKLSKRIDLVQSLIDTYLCE